MGRRITISLLTVLLLFCTGVLPVYGQDGDRDAYKWRIEGNWWFTHPTGSFGLNGSNANNYFDINKDFHFQSYSTFSGKADYHFRHKHHFLLNITPVSNSRTVTLGREITFQGQTFAVGAQVTASVKALNIAPGYQYDILRTDRGYLGIEADLNLLDTEGTLKAVGTTNNQNASGSASKSFFAPLPAVGPIGRWYPLPNSNRLSLEGSFRGMYFFGYGDFISSRANVGFLLTPHLALKGGYQLGSRLSVHGTGDAIGIRFTEKGPTAGLEYSWGEAPPRKPKAPPSSSTEPSDWHVDWIPFYLWFSGLSGNVGAGGYTTPVNVSFSDVLKDLNIGLMTGLDVRRKRVGLTTDLIFMNLSSDQNATPVGAFSGFTANVKELILQPELYYRVLERDKGTIDAEAGFRYWHMNNSLDLMQGSATPVTVGQTQGWVDPTLGARFRLNLPKTSFATVKGDVGGFGAGSSLSWQIYAVVGKEFKRRFSAMLGYRYLFVDYTNGGFVYDVHMSGLIAGLGIKLK
jgi:hypothetical protein